MGCARCGMVSNFLYLPQASTPPMHFCSGHQNIKILPPFHFGWTSPLKGEPVSTIFWIYSTFTKDMKSLPPTWPWYIRPLCMLLIEIHCRGSREGHHPPLDFFLMKGIFHLFWSLLPQILDPKVITRVTLRQDNKHCFNKYFSTIFWIHSTYSKDMKSLPLTWPLI